MIATCLLDGREVEVIKYKNIYYSKSDFYLPYRAYKRTKKPVKSGYEYSFYMIDGKLHEAVMTNDLDCIARQVELKRYRFTKYRMVKKYKQLSIFDMETL